MFEGMPLSAFGDHFLMPAKSISQKIAAREELDRRLNGEEPFKFKGLSDEDLKEISETPSDDLPERANL